jgi:hypothetical protein
MLAQTAPATGPASTSPTDEEIVTLDPFTVTTEHEGYQAVDTLGGGRIRTRLVDTPSSISVITKKLIQDLGVTNAQNLLIYTNNTEVAGLGGNFSGTTSRGQGSTGEGSLLAAPQNQTRARGIAALDNTRNYFLTDIPWDGYNISRVDISRGPNSFLFGFGSPSGIANVQTNEAVFSDKGTVEARWGSFGSTRESLDYNKVLIPSVLAVRLDLVNDHALYEQKPAYNHTKRAYGAVRFDPKLFESDAAHTKIQASFEHGDVTSNNPRTIPPTDYVTGYLNDPSAPKTGINPWTYALGKDGSNSHPEYTPWASNGSLANQFQWSNSMTYFWNPDGTLQKAGQAEFTAPTGANEGADSNTYFVHSQGYSGAAYAANYAWRVNHGGDVPARDLGDTPFKGAYFGTVTYLDKTLSDPSIFDYIHKLIDGNNKHEWQNWNAFNISVTETLFHDRLAIQGIVDHQDFRSGYENWLDNTVIALDLDQYLLTYPTWVNAQANPNVGRPALYGGQGSGHNQESTRNNYQVTAAYNLNFERDFGMKGAAASILGWHDFTALFGSYRQTQHNENYRLAGVDHAWNVAYNGSTAAKITDNGYNWTAYLGPSLLGTTGSGANLPNLSFSNAPIQANVTGYVKAWNAASSVDRTAPWTVTIPAHLQADGTMAAAYDTALTQADNPANYVGYAQTQMTTLLNPRDNMNLLRNDASLTDQKITSQAIMYQGHFWDDTIIPSVGYRRDKTQQRGTIGTVDSVTGMVSDVSRIDDPGVSATTNSTSFGVAVHLPKSIKKRLPEGTDVSLYYFHGNNETPKVRYGIDGAELPNEKGKTDDISIQLDALNNRASLRLTYFKTTDTAAPASYGQPLGNGVGWLINSLPSWTLSMAAYGIQASQIGAAGMNALGEGGNNWFWQWGVDHPEVAASIAPVLQNEFLAAYPESWWRSHQTNVNVAAIRAGDWMHVADGTNSPLPWNIYGTGTIHGQYPIIDQDVEAKGFELEATIKPLKNWDITFNAVKASAEQTALGEHTIKQLDAMSHLWLDTPLGQTAEWGSYTAYGTMKRQFITTLYGPYLTQRALTGTQQPEWSKLKFNIISNYSFDDGFAKGFNIGGAYRWEDHRIIGYGVSEQTVFGTPTWLADVKQPLWSPTESHFDLWVGYQHKLTAKLNWRIQLNVTNVGEKVHLVAIAMEPDGSVAQSRIANGQQFNLTSSISF